MTRMTGQDCAVIIMCNFINTHTHIQTHTGTGVETRGRTQDGSGDESGDGNERSSGDGNGDEDWIGEDGGETKKREKPHKNCGRDQALLLRRCHHLGRQGVS